MNKNEIILFETKDSDVRLMVQIQEDTVWLNRSQMAELFGRDIKTIGKHINNALREELDASTVAKFATVQMEGSREVSREIEYYNLDVIISVGYRVKSKRGVEFRRWANSVLKKYIIDGYAINEKRLLALEKTVDIQTRMLADALNIEEQDVLRAVGQYTEALTLLDQYDHQSIVKPDGTLPIYRITYEECMNMVSHMKDSFETELSYIIRDHDSEEFDHKLNLIPYIADTINRRYGEGTVTVKVKEQYRNMREKIEPHMHLIENAKKATEDVGLEAKIVPICGGTDGARLSYMGLPCPNLGTGGYAYHGPFEHNSAEGMENVVKILIGIVKKYAEY